MGSRFLFDGLRRRTRGASAPWKDEKTYRKTVYTGNINGTFEEKKQPLRSDPHCEKFGPRPSGHKRRASPLVESL